MCKMVESYWSQNDGKSFTRTTVTGLEVTHDENGAGRVETDYNYAVT